MPNQFWIKSVVFHQIFPSKDIVVPIDQAWDFYIKSQKDHMPIEVSGAWIIELNQAQSEIFTFAKGWLAWDETNKVWNLARIGLGANGDGGAVNPLLAA